MPKIAVIGVTDNIGREVLNFLADGGYKVKDITALEPNMPIGNQASFGEDEDIDIHNLDSFDFSKVDIALFCSTAEISKRYIPKALSAKIKVIDCSDAHSSDTDVPLVIAGVNDEQAKSSKKNMVSIPSFFTTQTLLPLKKIDEEYQIKRLIISTYTSTSAHGREGMDELFNQTRKIFMNNTLADNQQVFKKQIAFNVIPQVGEFIGEETHMEWLINAETKRILRPQVKVHANCAFVPAFIGSAQFINVECSKELDVDDVKKLMEKTKGVSVFDKQVDGGYFCLTDVQGEDNIYISRLRQDASVNNGFSFWVVADNLRAGIAKNAYNVMKLMLG